jgi:copper homeostasis protein (lipoprotein)
MNKWGFLLFVLPIMLVTGCKQPEQAAVANLNTDAGPVLTPVEGMFRYMADAATFRDCRTNKTFPVSMEGEYIELERAYLNSGIEPGSEIMLKLNGRFLERPAMEGNNNIIKLIVDKPYYLLPEETCAPTVHAELIGTYWKLVMIDGEAVNPPQDRKEAHMILASADSRSHGNAGCNNFFGHFETAGNTLTFSAIGSTMMACPQASMDRERDFLSALDATTRYAISGLFLELYAEDRLLARFEAVYL